MAYFEPAVITRTGVNLIANDIAGIGNIEFVKMVAGAGEYTEEEKAKNALAERTALKDQRQEFVFNAIEVKSEKSVLLKSVISNQTLEEGYRITEVGIYAREKGTEGDGFLYSLALAIEADYLPPFNGLNPSEIVQEYYATVSDAATVSIVSAPGAFALYEDMKALENIVADKIKEFTDNIGNAEDTYNNESTYAFGDYCIHDKQLYKCIIPITEPEEWNGEHWKKVTIAEELLYLANKEVEVVDPTIATEVGFAADAKLTGDALREVSANIAQKANASTVNTNLTNLSNRIASIENIQKNYVTGNQSGTVKFGTLLAKRKDQATVVFPKKFTKTPSISLSATSSSSGNTFLRATYASVNASSFVIQIENIDGALGITDVSVTWNAWV